MEKQLVPEFRFPEFKDDWVEKKGEQLFTSSRTKGREGIPIYSVTLNRGMVPRDSIGRRMENDAATKDNLRAQKGDLVYNMMRMWQGAVGLANEECMVSPAYVVLRPKANTDSQFFEFNFNRARPLYNLWAYSYGLTNDRLRLYFKDFSKIKFMIPSSKNEQQKIAAFLSSIDEKINKLSRKRRLLDIYKRGLMKKLFTKEIRFKKDDGSDFSDWDEGRLSDISTKFSSNISANSLSESSGAYKVYGASGYLQCVDFYLEEKPYISIVKDGAGVGKVLLCDEKSSVLGTLDVIRNKGKNKLQYLYYYLAQMRYSKYIIGSTIPHIYYRDYSNEKIQIPSPAEQVKIANSLEMLDRKIVTATHLISQLETFKKGLLQKLFL